MMQALGDSGSSLVVEGGGQRAGREEELGMMLHAIHVVPEMEAVVVVAVTVAFGTEELKVAHYEGHLASLSWIY